MKMIWLSLFGLVAIVLASVASGLAGYYYSAASIEPGVVVETMPVEVVKTVEVIKTVEVVTTVEVMVTPEPVLPTPAPLIIAEPEQPPCQDAARVVLQPRDNANSAAMKVGQIKRLHFQIQNTGDCIWDGYVLSSGGVLPDIPVPLTFPGETADILYDIRVGEPIEARWSIQPPMGDTLLVSNSASPGVGLETIYYRLDVKQRRGDYEYICGPGGCRRNFRYQ